MPWPALAECERFIDWSWYQNHGGLLRKPFDVNAFCDAHPEVDGAVIRFCWPSGAVDKHYAHYYDGFKANGKKVMGYGWANGMKAVADTMEDWKTALGDRIPVVIGKDWEEASVFAGMNRGSMTDLIKASHELAQITFPDSEHMDYSRASWLDVHVLAGDWINDRLWWLAHWIYPAPDFADMAKSFAEIDTMLPIDNNFTPYRGRIVNIPLSQVIGWQVGSRFEIVPRGTSDGGYFLKSFLDQHFGEGPPPPSNDVPDWIGADIRAIAQATQEQADLGFDLADTVDQL